MCDSKSSTSLVLPKNNSNVHGEEEVESNKKLTFQWDPNEVITNCSTSYAVILLNHSMEEFGPKERAHFTQMWNKASLRVAVDGGANYLTPNEQLPHIVSGDLDSITSETLKRFKLCDGVSVMHTPDQDETDFTKAVRIVLEDTNHSPFKIEQIVAFCGSRNGRIDHLMANLNTVLKFVNQIPIFLVHSGKSINWFLKEGHHKIIPFARSTWVSLVPIAGPVTATTSGLRWNLTNDTLAFDSLISTSNEFDTANADDLVEIHCNGRILFSMDITGRK